MVAGCLNEGASDIVVQSRVRLPASLSDPRPPCLSCLVSSAARSLRHVTVEEKKNPPDCKSLGRTLQFLIKPTQMCTCFVYRSFYRFLLNKLQVRSFSLSIGTDVNCVASTDCAIARSMYLIISDAFSNHQQSSRLK